MNKDPQKFNVITQLKTETVLGKENRILQSRFIFRESVRAIIVNEKKQIGLMHVGKQNYYKLAGGGVESGETLIAALKREILEESGYQMTNQQYLASILEFREETGYPDGLIQFDHLFLIKVKGKQQALQLTTKELQNNYGFVWINSDQALSSMQQANAIDNNIKFIIAREIKFLEYYLENIKQK
ncbi:MAG: NUDIX domain-containing protein [bacterium]